MTRRAQHGRKPQKAWHKRGADKRLAKATRRWPSASEETAHDGAPTPLRQRSKGTGWKGHA